MAHRWRFYRIGGIDQVRLETAEDLLQLDQLDQKLWVALSCPTTGLEIEERTLDFIDADDDQRVRVRDVLEAVQWTRSVIRDPGELTEGGRPLPLTAINADVAEGQRILNSAREILQTLGKSEDVISVEDVTDRTAFLSQTRFNGDGVIVPESADEESERTAIEEILQFVEPETDRSGKPGLSQPKLDAFFGEARAYLQWQEQAETDGETIFPLGEATADAAAAVEAVGAKVDDYFRRCRLAEYDPRILEALSRRESGYLTGVAEDMDVTQEELADLPLARVEPERALPLGGGINPAWAEAVRTLAEKAVEPLLGAREALTEEEWRQLREKLAAYANWRAAEPQTGVGALGVERLRGLTDGGVQEALAELIQRDLALADEFSSIELVEKLARFFRDLETVLNNFVTFRDFYDLERSAIFQAGTLYLDRRSCDLCVEVSEVEKHSTFAAHSKLYLAYCDCSRKGGEEKKKIVAAFTDGDSEYITVGRNGVFYDREGQDWDATIVKLVEQAISIRQAFWSPYKRIGRLIREQIERFATTREKAVQEGAAAKLASVQQTAPQAPEEAEKAGRTGFDIARFAGVFAAIGLAIGALGSAVAVIVTRLLSLAWWQIPLTILGVLLIVSGPSMIIAWLKLRDRNLAPILDANGWAVNGRVRINIPFGRRLTTIARLPKGAKRTLRDPYRRRRWPWIAGLIILFILGSSLYFLNETGRLYEWTGRGKQLEPAVQQPTAPQPAGDTKDAEKGAAPAPK